MICEMKYSIEFVARFFLHRDSRRQNAAIALIKKMMSENLNQAEYLR
jgi:hypothetical protein